MENEVDAPHRMGPLPHRLGFVLAASLLSLLVLAVFGFVYAWPPAIVWSWRAAWVATLVLLAIRAVVGARADSLAGRHRLAILLVAAALCALAGLAASRMGAGLPGPLESYFWWIIAGAGAGILMLGWLATEQKSGPWPENHSWVYQGLPARREISYARAFIEFSAVGLMLGIVAYGTLFRMDVHPAGRAVVLLVALSAMFFIVFRLGGDWFAAGLFKDRFQ